MKRSVISQQFLFLSASFWSVHSALAQILPFPVANQEPIPIYISKQNKKSTRYVGSHEKTTDKYEHGSVKLTSQGPIVYSVDPIDLSIGTNSSKSWNGNISGNIEAAPDAGNSVNARIDADYEWTFSRAVGSGKGGTIQKVQECQPFEPGGRNNCSFHPQGSGKHEIVHFTGKEQLNFQVFSISANIPDTIYVRGPEAVVSDINAEFFPAEGGEITWTALTDVVSIPEGEKSANPRIKLNDPMAEGKVQVELKFGDAVFNDVAAVKKCICKECSEKAVPDLFLYVSPQEWENEKMKPEILEDIRLADVEGKCGWLADFFKENFGRPPLDVKLIAEYVKRCSLGGTCYCSLCKGISFFPQIMAYQADEELIESVEMPRKEFLRFYAEKLGIKPDNQYHCVRIPDWTEINPFLPIDPKTGNPTSIVASKHFSLSTIHSMHVYGSYEIKLSQTNFGVVSYIRNKRLRWCATDEMDANDWEEYKNKWIAWNEKGAIGKNLAGLIETLFADNICDIVRRANFRVKVYFKDFDPK
jgi:hypothetical protein